MLDLIINYIRSFFVNKKENIKSENLEVTISVSWEDISNGISKSQTSSIINHAFKANGYEVITRPSSIIFNDEFYYPEQLSDHWHLWIGSPKIKPINITYRKM
jgi:hypothetical protein